MTRDSRLNKFAIPAETEFSIRPGCVTNNNDSGIIKIDKACSDQISIVTFHIDSCGASFHILTKDTQTVKINIVINLMSISVDFQKSTTVVATSVLRAIMLIQSEVPFQCGFAPVIN